MATVKLYYDDPYRKEMEATVLACEPDGKNFRILLDETCFYPEGGGQAADHGEFLVKSEAGALDAAGADHSAGLPSDAQPEAAAAMVTANVTDVHEKAGEIWHTVDRAIPVGTRVHGILDWERRFDLMQQHSGEHIVSGMIHNRYGYDNIGFHLGSGRIEIDFNGEIPEEDLRSLEEAANRYIVEDHAIEITWPSPAKLSALEYRSKKELSGDVRIVTWPGADCCACCGTHVLRSGEVGPIVFTSSMRMKGGTRIEMICGGRTLKYLWELKNQVDQISHLLSAQWDETAKAVTKLHEESVRMKAEKVHREQEHADELIRQSAGAGNVLFVEGDLSPDVLRRLANDTMEVCGGICAAFAGTDETGYRYFIGQKDGDVRSLVKEVNMRLDGKGGGRPYFAQGSVKTTAAGIRELYQELWG